MQLADDIYQYYLAHQASLTEDKLFHFGTRMAAWRGTNEAFAILKNMRPMIVQPDKPLQEVISNIFHTPQTDRRNAHELRQPFFEKYPELYGAHLALFRVRHLQEVYGIDARDELFAVMPLERLQALEAQLLSDDEAIKILSTFAINYCYLLERVILRRDDTLPLQHFFDLGKTYDVRAGKEQAQLLIYLYTHCIIGESNFYVRRIPEQSLPLYRDMLRTIEPMIREYFTDINLDNKLEFLVCAQICGYTTDLAGRIYDECSQSLSSEGTFLIDRFNSNGQSDRNDFARSEHRNVLFIMSTSPYAPHSTLVNE